MCVCVCGIRAFFLPSLPLHRLTYGLSSILQKLLQEWVALSASVEVSGFSASASASANASPRRYLFPNRDHPDAHISTSSVRRAFMRVAARAGVRGSHVHPHTTRPDSLEGAITTDPLATHGGLDLVCTWVKAVFLKEQTPVWWQTAWSPWQGSLGTATPR